MKTRRPTPADAVYNQAGERIVFRFQPGWSVPFAELRGDLVHWQEGLEMSPTSGGFWQVSTRVPTGTYGYKFLIGGSSWQLDPANARTRSVDGQRNSLLVVGGTDEPIMHAPAPPYLHLRDSGELCVRAGLRRSAFDALSVSWDEGHGLHTTAMTLVAEEDEHLLMEACLPASAHTIEYLFVLPDGRYLGRAGSPGQAFRVELSSLRRTTPTWWRDAALYTIFVDRFRRGGVDGRWDPEKLALRDGTIAGGDLEGIVEALPHLIDLGVTALHLTPIVLARSSHRYDAVDLRVVDPALGGEEALQKLFDEALAVGMRVLLDVSVTHVHRDFFAFRDVRARGQASPYWDWFYPLHHPFREGLVPGYLHYRKGVWQEPLLRLDNPEVADYLVGTFEHWARAGADGFRIDAAADVPLDLLRRITAAVRSIRPDSAVFGEVVTDNIHRFGTGVFDAATDFPSQEALYDWVWRNRLGATAAAAAWRRRRFWRGAPGWSAISFVGTHDQHRLRTLTGDAQATRLALLLTLMRAEVPALYYGDEAGLCGPETGRSFEDNWPDRQCMPWDRSKWDQQTWNLVRDALRLRASIETLRRGNDQFLSVQGTDGSADDILVLRRVWAEQVVDVVLHAGEGTRTIPLWPDAPSSARVLLPLGEASFDVATASLTLGAWSGAVVERLPSADASCAWRAVVESNRQAGIEAFREGAVEWLGLPSHLYLTVTEGCNLRCKHCINHSPERTRNGTAREMRPWLLDRLHEALSAADYFAFTHGGESLTSPMLPAVLGAIQKAHQARSGRTDVHLLTNGMLLTSDTTRSLVDLGVTSIGVSLDGAHSETSERIRLGSSHPTVIRNIRHAVRARTDRQYDLRIGISMVVGESNLPELVDMGKLALDLGIDWLKIEEFFPSTAWARQELIAPMDSRLADGMAALRQVLAGSSLVLVDHLAPPAGCRCEARDREDLREFRRADDYANRATFQPCRAAWQQACVDPDGAVHPVDYHNRAVGSLLNETMLDLWHNNAMRSLRREALARIAAPLRWSCPIDEPVAHGIREASKHG